MLGQAIEGVASERCARIQQALQNVVSAFPPKSTGRRRVISLAASAVGDRKELAKAVLLSPRYVSKCARVVNATSSVITKTSGSTREVGLVAHGQKHGQQYSQIRGIEGKLLEQFIFSHASSKSGQKERTTGWVT